MSQMKIVMRFSVLLLSVALVACGITAPSSDDGFADLDSLGFRDVAQGWEPIISIREPGERTVMLMKVKDELILGLTVINCDTYEAVIVNVMGELRPKMFAETMVALEVDVPGVQVAGAGS